MVNDVCAYNNVQQNANKVKNYNYRVSIKNEPPKHFVLASENLH